MKAHLPINASRGPKQAGRVEGWVSPDGLLRLRILGNSTRLTSEDIRDLEHVRENLVDRNSSIYCLMDSRGVSHVDTEVRHRKPHEDTKRLAVLIDSAVGRVLGNAFMALAKPTCPTRLFTSEKQAVKWLLIEGKDQ